MNLNGYCNPWGGAGGDLCLPGKYKPLPATCQGALTDGYLPSTCDRDCIEERCRGDDLCVGYTWDKSGKRAKLKAKITSTSGSGNYECHKKLQLPSFDLRNDKAYCEPWGGAGGDLCSGKNYSPLPATCKDASNGYLPIACGRVCVEARCHKDVKCVGYTWNGSRGKLKAAITGATANGAYKCYQKPRLDPEEVAKKVKPIYRFSDNAGDYCFPDDWSLKASLLWVLA